MSAGLLPRVIGAESDIHSRFARSALSPGDSCRIDHYLRFSHFCRRKATDQRVCGYGLILGEAATQLSIHSGTPPALIGTAEKNSILVPGNGGGEFPHELLVSCAPIRACAPTVDEASGWRCCAAKNSILALKSTNSEQGQFARAYGSLWWQKRFFVIAITSPRQRPRYCSFETVGKPESVREGRPAKKGLIYSLVAGKSFGTS
jgi:hypothetical protein